jgi:CheY-like chemotaxis protein
MKILIADDENEVLKTLQAILQKGGGFETDFARDGAEALAKVKAGLYDALLLDIMMPKLNGYEVLQEVRKIFPTMPIIFISAHGESKKIEESIRTHNLTALIEKPFTPKEVLEIVDKAIRAKKVE